MQEDHKAKKTFTLTGLTLITISGSFGSGIFFSVSQTASQVPDKTWILLAWLAGGIISLAGALTFAELGSRFPSTGGVYVYLKETLGELWAFLYGWSSLTVITSGAIAALAAVFINNIDYFFHFSQTSKTVMGCITILVLMLINILSNRFSEWIAGSLTILKIAGVAVIILIGFLFRDEALADQTNATPFIFSAANFGLALIGVMWAYGGWHHMAALAGETSSASNKIPKAMILGCIIITAIYMLTNWSYLQLLTPAALAQSPSPAAEAIGNITKEGSAVMAALIAVSVFATASIYTFATPRVYYQMGVDGSIFKWIGKMHPKHNIPVRAIVLQSLWAIVLLIGWQTFSEIISYVTLTDWIFLTLTGAGVIIMRMRKVPGSGYKVPLYPFVPLLFIISAGLFIFSVCWQNYVCALVCLSFVASGTIIFYVSRMLSKN